MSVTPALLTKTVTTAATRVQVTSDTGIKPHSVYFEAFGTNTGFIYIGNSSVSSTVYFARLPVPSTSSSPSWSITAAETGSSRGEGIQLSDLYVDSSVSGDKVQVTYVYRIGG